MVQVGYLILILFRERRVFKARDKYFGHFVIFDNHTIGTKTTTAHPIYLQNCMGKRKKNTHLQTQ